MLAALAALWAFPPRFTPPGAINTPKVFFVEDHSGGVRLAPPWEPGSTAIVVDIKQNWPSREFMGVPVLVRDSQAILGRTVPQDLHGGFNPFQQRSQLAGRVVALAALLRDSHPTDARLILTPEYSRRHIHWPGVLHLAIAAIRLLAACVLLTGLLFLTATRLGLGRAATLQLLALDGHCPRCGYDLSGLITMRCPECGSTDSAHRFTSTSSVVPAIAESYEHA